MYASHWLLCGCQNLACTGEAEAKDLIYDKSCQYIILNISIYITILLIIILPGRLSRHALLQRSEAGLDRLLKSKVGWFVIHASL